MPKKFLIHVDFVGPARPGPAPPRGSVKCQLLILRFVGPGCQPGFRLYASKQSFWSKVAPKLENSLLIFFRVAMASQPFPLKDILPGNVSS